MCLLDFEIGYRGLDLSQFVLTCSQVTHHTMEFPCFFLLKLERVKITIAETVAEQRISTHPPHKESVTTSNNVEDASKCH